jgi:hypothetical protein
MNSIRILITCNSHAKLASASLSHSKHYTGCLEKACQSTWIYTGLSKTFYINKVSKSQPSSSYRPLYGRGLRKWTRPSHTHTPISRQVIQSSWKESWLCLVARENNPYHLQRLMNSPQNKACAFTHLFHFRSLWWEHASCEWRQRRVPNQRLKYCPIHGTHDFVLLHKYIQ